MTRTLSKEGVHRVVHRDDLENYLDGMIGGLGGSRRYEPEVTRLDPISEDAPGDIQDQGMVVDPAGRHVYEGGLPDSLWNLIAQGLCAASPKVDRIVQLDLGPSYPDSSTVQSTGVDCRPGTPTDRRAAIRGGPGPGGPPKSRTGDVAAWRGCPALERYTEAHVAASG